MEGLAARVAPMGWHVHLLAPPNVLVDLGARIGNLKESARIDGEVAGLPEHQRLAVRRGLYGGVHAEVAAGTGLVVDDDGSALLNGHPVGHFVRNHVGPPPAGKGTISLMGRVG